MTQFGASSPQQSFQRAGGRGIGNQGFNDSIQVVPVPTLPAGTGNLVALSEIDRILNIAGSATGAINQTIAAKTNKINRENEKVDMLDRALANRHAREDAVNFGTLIDEGKLKVPDGVSITDFAESVVNDEIKSDPGASEAYINEYRDLAPVIAEKLAMKQKRDRSQANADNLDLMVDRAFSAKSPTDVQQAVAFSVQNLGVTERQAQASVVIPAMRQAAQLGDTAKVEMLAASLPQGAFTGDVDQLKMAAAASQAKIQTNEWQKGDDIVQSLFDSNVAMAQIRDSVDELHSAGRLAPGKADQWRKIIDTRESQAQTIAKTSMIDAIAAKRLYGATMQDLQPDIKRLLEIDPSSALQMQNSLLEAESKAERQRVELEKHQLKQGIIAEGMAAAAGGFLGSARDVTVLASDGKTEITMSANDVKQEAMNAAFAQIDQEEMKKTSGNYAAAFPAAQARKVRLAGQNGVLPESFKQTLAAGATAANPQIMLEGTPPPATVAAYSLYRQMLADAPALAERAADGKAKELFDNAAVLQSDFKTNTGADDVAGALAAAARNVFADPMVKAGSMERLKAADVTSAAKGMTGRSFGQAVLYNATGGIIPGVPGFAGRARNDVKNLPEVEAAIRTRAAAYLPTKSPEDAIKIATDRVEKMGKVVDGWWVRLPGDLSERTKTALPDVVASKADEWTKQNQNSGVDRWNIRVTMEPSGRFVLIDNTTGFPLSPPVILTPQQIDDSFSEMARQKAAAASKNAIGAAKDTAEIQKKIDQQLTQPAPNMWSTQ